MSEWTIERAGEFLRKGRWFAQQPEDFCMAVLSRSEIRTYEAHQRICHNGDPPSGVYAVLEGQVNLVAVLDNLGKGASGAAVQNMDLMLSRKAA